MKPEPVQTDENAVTDPLPTVAGVGPSRHWLPAGSWKTVLDFLTDRFPGVSTATWSSRMAKGQVMDNTGLRLDSESPYRVGACIFYYRELDSEKRIPFVERILYQDEHIVVVDKPHFLPVVPSGRFLHETLLVRLKKQGNQDSLVPIHLLDRETAGVVLFSLNPKTRGCYTSLFQERKVTKTYEALARNPSPNLTNLRFPLTRRSRIVVGEPFFRMKEVDGKPNSETRVNILTSTNNATLYQLVPVTGKKHQIRVHLSALGIPIVNDRLYPVLSVPGLFDNDDFSSPLKLLAKSISFQDPLTGRELYFESGRTL